MTLIEPFCDYAAIIILMTVAKTYVSFVSL